MTDRTRPGEPLLHPAPVRILAAGISYEHSGASDLTESKQTTVGLTITAAATIENTASISVTAEAGFGLHGFGASLTATISNELMVTTTHEEVRKNASTGARSSTGRPAIQTCALPTPIPAALRSQAPGSPDDLGTGTGTGTGTGDVLAVPADIKTLQGLGFRRLWGARSLRAL